MTAWLLVAPLLLMDPKRSTWPTLVNPGLNTLNLICIFSSEFADDLKSIYYIYSTFILIETLYLFCLNIVYTIFLLFNIYLQIEECADVYGFIAKSVGAEWKD